MNPQFARDKSLWTDPAMDATKYDFASFEVSGMFHPIANLSITRSSIAEKDINVAKTFIHENVHRFQYLVSSAGLTLRASWHYIYQGIIAAFSADSPIELPLKNSFASLLAMAEAKYPEASDVVSDAFRYVANWTEFGRPKTSDESCDLCLRHVLSGDIELRLSPEQCSFVLRHPSSSREVNSAVTVDMVFESMAYFHALNSRLVFYLGDNRYLSRSGLAADDEDVKHQRRLMQGLSPEDIVSKYVMEPMPPSYRLPHAYLIANIDKKALTSGAISTVFGHLNTVAATVALLGADYIHHSHGPFLPEVYARALEFLAKEYFSDWEPEAVLGCLSDAHGTKACLDSVISRCLDSGDTLQSLVERQLRLFSQTFGSDPVLAFHLSKTEKLANAILDDPTYLVDAHNLILNLFEFDSLGYITGDTVLRENLDEGDRHLFIMTLVFDLLWDRDNLGCHIANSEGSWDDFPDDEAFSYTLARVLTAKCGDFKACRERLSRSEKHFCSNDYYRAHIRVVLDELEKYGVRDKLRIRAEL